MKYRLEVDSAFGYGSVRAAAGVLPVALAVVCGGVATAANSSSEGPSAGNSGAQPGITTGPGVPVAELNSPAVDQNIAVPSADHAVPSRHYVVPVDVTRLHTPAPVRPIEPMAVLPGTIRIGDVVMPAAWMPAAMRTQINTAAVGAESGVCAFARSVGVNPKRVDRIASMAAVSGLVTAVPGALVGGVIGGAGGGVVGGVVGGVIGGVITAVPGALVGGMVGAAT